jgi:hypothetical protein
MFNAFMFFVILCNVGLAYYAAYISKSKRMMILTHILAFVAILAGVYKFG